MRIHLNFNPNPIVCIKRNKDRIIYNSGLIYFDSFDQIQYFYNNIGEEFEVFEVDIKQAHGPIEQLDRGYWCPFCQSWEYWNTDANGCKKCPICGISDNEYYVKMYNNLWNQKMQSKNQKKKMDNYKMKMKRRKK